MKFRFLFSIFLMVFCCFQSKSAEEDLIRLDREISQREKYQNKKLSKIDSIYRLTLAKSKREDLLDRYEKLFQEYLTFNFDSAILYVDKAEKLILPSDDYDLRSKVSIHRALSLATSGHFSHAINILAGIDSRKLSRKVREEYFAAFEWTYGVWAEYADKRSVAPDLNKKSLVYLDSLIDVTDRTIPEYSYRVAEKHLRENDYKSAVREYLNALNNVSVDSRLYAQATYALALAYKGLGDNENYQKWLVNAAISDQMVPLKENLALQQLAMYLNDEKGDLERANSYLKLALEDAIFYNNRLRMLEVAEKIPNIANVYQDSIGRQNHRLKILVCIIVFLVLLLGAVVIFIYRQRQAVSRSKDAVVELNEKLKLLNTQLNQTNKSREQYVSLFMDLCAAYIDKLNRFPMYLKVKVKHLDELNLVSDRYVRPTETEAREMFRNFDTAFLRLYPNFISEFNSLLQPEKQISPKKGELLNTDLRIYALVRMGISDSNKIATLLFLSPQTIFNHRTQMRNRAQNRESFEKEVTEICPIIS